MCWGETTGFHGPSSDPVRRLSGPPRCSHHPALLSSSRVPPLDARLPVWPSMLAAAAASSSSTSTLSVSGDPASPTVYGITDLFCWWAPAATAKAATGSGPSEEGRKGKSPKGGGDLRVTLLLYGAARTSSTTALCSSSTTARRALLGGRLGDHCVGSAQRIQRRERGTR